MVTKLQVLSNVSMLSKVLARRELSVTMAGKVWSDELSTFVSCAEAYLAGIGKARRSKEEQEVFDLLLLDTANKQAIKAVKSRGHKLDWDKEKLLDLVINLQERMAKGMLLIKKSNEAISALWKKNQYAGYVYKAWSTPVGERTDKQLNSLGHPNNKVLVQWFDCRKKLWDNWNKLGTECQKLAKEFNLWPAYYSLAATAFCQYGIDRRACTRDEGLDYNEPASGLTGQWEYDVIGSIADEHVKENAPLQAALRSCEHYQKRKLFRGATRSEAKRDIAWAKARRHGGGLVSKGELPCFQAVADVEDEAYVASLLVMAEQF